MPESDQNRPTGGRCARMRALQHWLWRTQIWSNESLCDYRLRRLEKLLRHASATVPFYRDRFRSAGIDPGQPLGDQWQSIPLLSRRDIQSSGDAIHATHVPASHGRTFQTLTGGSTGQPVLTVGTERTACAWQAFALRDHFWHHRDFSLTLACIRHTRPEVALAPQGKSLANWGPSISPFLRTGPGAMLNIDSTTRQQADWLMKQNPGYLLGYPSCIFALAKHFRDRPGSLPNLREVRTFGEVVEPPVRRVCQDVFGVPLVDVYSSQELGYIALQCPSGRHYHVQEETVFLEVLDGAGAACRAGQTGKVVITSLHNFAMPLIRYDIGDFAEVGTSCECGRNLMVLNRILGRQRNMLVLPNGDQVWPVLSFDDGGRGLSSITQMQVVQTSLRDIEVNLVASSRLTREHEQRLARYIKESLPGKFNVTLRYVDSIPRSRSRKFEDFRCDVSAT